MYLMPAENCLSYIYTRVYDGLELRFEVPLHSQCLPSLCILEGGGVSRLRKCIQYMVLFKCQYVQLNQFKVATNNYFLFQSLKFQ